ncbi:zinc finger protein 836-like [Trematomus bernacchii]|uniref:zinc finger protein 836-like n=1 Tax=Trematomus bernacchii TaxID=40690 RepID=UPI00146D3029|nr:zinc finger protein 836-like [Trematomus bernacchii]
MMSSTLLLKLRVSERLEAAVEEVFGLVEKTVSEYQEEAVRSKREILQLRVQIEQLTVLKPRVILLSADTQTISQEILPSQKPEQLPPNVEEKEICDSLQIKEEQADCCIAPDIAINVLDTQADPSYSDTHHKTEPATNCQLLPPSPAVTSIVSKITDNTFDQRNGVSLPPRSQKVNRWILPALNNCSSKDVNIRLMDTTTTAPNDTQLFPTYSSITVTLNDDCNGNASSGSSSCAPIHSDSAFMEQEQTQKDDRTCPFYGKDFNTDSDLIKHVDKVHMTTKAFKCPECDKSFVGRFLLTAHLRIHTGEKPYKCSYCAKSFAQRSNLNVHTRMHTGEKPYFCNTCRKKVASTNHLKKCRAKDLKFLCLKCDQRFLTYTKLWNHDQNHKASTSHTH